MNTQTHGGATHQDPEKARVLREFKEKYLDIVRREGVDAAITQLHKDVERIENLTFETPAGYQPELFRDLIDIREFSRDLWEVALQHPEKISKP